MEIKNKILLMEPNPNISKEIARSLKNSGFEITDIAPFLFDVVNAIDKTEPDVVMIDGTLDEQMAEFISDYIKLPIIIITNQLEKELYRFSDKVKLLSIIRIPFSSDSIRTATAIAFNKIKKNVNHQ